MIKSYLTYLPFSDEFRNLSQGPKELFGAKKNYGFDHKSATKTAKTANVAELWTNFRTNAAEISSTERCFCM